MKESVITGSAMVLTSLHLHLMLLVGCAYSQFYQYNNRGYSRQSRYQSPFSSRNSYNGYPGYRRSYQTTPRTTSPRTTTHRTTTAGAVPVPTLPSVSSKYSEKCGLRKSKYRPDQRARKGRIIVPDSRSAGAAVAPDGSFPWLASLFLRRESGEAYFMCAATVLTPTVLVSAAHCFNEKWKDNSWYVRVGDNYIAKVDPSEQTFQVDRILKHSQFVPLSRPGGDGKNDIALLKIRPRKGRTVKFSSYVRPACLPALGSPLSKWRSEHCEIAGWGMQEYNNTSSYPTSVRAAKIKVDAVSSRKCDGLYGRRVGATGKFCAGGRVDACQEDSGGPLMCSYGGRYHLVGIVSSGKGCGSYPGLYTEVAQYSDWIERSLEQLENEVA